MNLYGKKWLKQYFLSFKNFNNKVNEGINRRSWGESQERLRDQQRRLQEGITKQVREGETWN